MKEKVNIFWFRRDLRIDDNVGLFHALSDKNPVIPIFIFDKNILKHLDKTDKRVSALYDIILDLNREIQIHGSALKIIYEEPLPAFKQLFDEFDIEKVYCNHDYEPYAIDRDKKAGSFFKENRIELVTFKDQVIFEKKEIVKDDGKPYLVFTPYMNKWKSVFNNLKPNSVATEKYLGNIFKYTDNNIPGLESMGFQKVSYNIPSKNIDEDKIKNYDKTRDFPGMDGTSRLGFHLRFGTVGIRQLMSKAAKLNEKYLEELVWREFYMMILWHFPNVTDRSFKSKYDRLKWNDSLEDFEKWKNGKTGFPFVDAGMRQLNETGFMHNRVRMVTASFLTKNLMVDWRWGESCFAEKLMDYELSSNNGGWQWAAGTGVDAAPYFRVFNPETQAKKYDKAEKYIKQWILEYGSSKYPEPMLDLKQSRKNAIDTYKKVAI